MKGTERGLARQCLQRHRRFLLQQTARGGHFLYLLLLRVAFFRLAAFARAKTFRLRGCNVRVKANIFPQRATRTAGRTAANAGGQHGKNKLTIGAGITFAYRLPAALIGINHYRFHHGLLL